jgi:hypothetical protein
MQDKNLVPWLEALERRHLAHLTFSEVRRAVQALSSLYVERRGVVDARTAFSGAGKRAAFAMYFAPIHFLLVRQIVRALDARIPANASIMDLGCGTGVAGAAWALELEPRPSVVGVDRSSWALQECKWTYEQLGVAGVVRNAEVGSMRMPANTAVIAAFTMNELDAGARDKLHRALLRVARTGLPVLIVEPIARSIATWWDEWARDWKNAGGRADEWRFRVHLPDQLALMDRASRLDHSELTGRSLWLPPMASGAYR